MKQNKTHLNGHRWLEIKELISLSFDDNGNLKGGPFDDIYDVKFIERTSNLIIEDDNTINKDAVEEIQRLIDLHPDFDESCDAIKIVNLSNSIDEAFKDEIIK